MAFELIKASRSRIVALEAERMAQDKEMFQMRQQAGEMSSTIAEEQEAVSEWVMHTRVHSQLISH